MMSSAFELPSTSSVRTKKSAIRASRDFVAARILDGDEVNVIDFDDRDGTRDYDFQTTDIDRGAFLLRCGMGREQYCSVPPAGSIRKGLRAYQHLKTGRDRHPARQNFSR